MLIENLLIYCRPAYEDSTGRKILHAFPLPKESEQYSAQRWSGWDEGNGKATLLEFEGDRTFPEFTGLELYGLDKRYNGGRAYQVLIPMYDKEDHWLRCDLREDSLMDTITMRGIEQGGKLNGRFAFVRDGAQTNLVLVGSKVYEKHKERANKKKTQRKIKISDLKIGYAYNSEYSSKMVYLGAVYRNEKHNFDGLSKYSDPKKAHMFLKVDSYYKGSGRFDFKKTVSFTYESGEQIYTESDCDNLIQEYVKNSIDEMKTYSQDIEGVFLKWYNHYSGKDRGGRMWYEKSTFERKAREEFSYLKDRAFDMYVNSVINKDKSAVVMDKTHVKALCDEATRKGLESIQEYDFLQGESLKWL